MSDTSEYFWPTPMISDLSGLDLLLRLLMLVTYLYEGIGDSLTSLVLVVSGLVCPLVTQG